MKKLITAAVAMASVAAMAGICDTLGPVQKDLGCRAYDFKASVKLVDGKTGSSKSAGTICIGPVTSTAYYRIAATRKVKGVFTDCNPCNYTNSVNAEALLVGPTANGAPDFAHFFVSTSASKYKAVSTTEDPLTLGATANYDFKILNFFGAATADKAKKAEALVAIDFVEYDQFGEFRPWSILCAGFGAQANGLVKNLSGNLAGAVAAATWCGIPTLVFEPCALHPSYTDLVIAADGTITKTDDACAPWSQLVDGVPSWSTDAVSGTWSLKYNASESKLATFNALAKKVFGADADWTCAKPDFAVPTYPLTIVKAL